MGSDLYDCTAFLLSRQFAGKLTLLMSGYPKLKYSSPRPTWWRLTMQRNLKPGGRTNTWRLRWCRTRSPRNQRRARTRRPASRGEQGPNNSYKKMPSKTIRHRRICVALVATQISLKHFLILSSNPCICYLLRLIRMPLDK